MGKLTVLDRTGHTTVEWDPAVEEETNYAAGQFAEIVRSNYGIAYAPSTEKGGTFEQIREFDPTAEEIIVRGPLVGG